MADIEPAFTPLVSICRELPTEAGFLDNLWLTPDGGIVLGECKLVRNPQARREVIAQALDYARAISKWRYHDLEAAVLRVAEPRGQRLWSRLEDRSELDEAQFVDAIERRLRSGRFLILVIGDGIQEGVEALAADLQLHAGLHASLALVELSCWRNPSGGLFVVPRIPLRTVLIERGIVVIEGGSGARIDPPRATPVPSGPGVPRPMTASEPEFYEQLDAKYPGISSQLRAFLDGLDEPGVTPEFRKSIILRWRVSEDVTGSLGYIDRWGTAYFGDAWNTANKIGVPEAGRQYLQAIASAVGGSVKIREKATPTVLGRDGRELKVDALLTASTAWNEAISQLVARSLDAARTA